MTAANGPLFDTLFRSTTEPAPRTSSVASAAPVRVTGTRTRAGNAMDRTRSALLSGAARAVATTGTRITMSQVATCAGVAKATLYNHFRTRQAVLDALVLDQVGRVVLAQTGKPLERALVDAAVDISQNPAVRGLATYEPAALAALGRVDGSAPGWQQAHDAVAEALAASSRAGVDTVLRWLASFLLTPAATDAIVADASVLLAGLPVLEAAPSAAAPLSA